MSLDERWLRRFLALAVALAGMGVWFFVLRGSDQPADPVLGPSVPSVAANREPPGDPDRIPLEGFSEVAIAVERPDSEGFLAWCLLSASNDEQRRRGLMGVTDLQGYSGMAFLYQQDQDNAFYMRNTPTPLSIAWVDASGALVSTADMEPCQDREGCPVYPPAGPYRLAVEVPQGQLDELGITAGSRVTLSGSCAPRST